jgi:hypothetical protein
VLQVDSYAGFERLTVRGDIVPEACGVHMKRKFYDVHQETGSPIAAEALQWIGALYTVERQISVRRADERRVARAERSRPLVDAKKAWLEDQLHLVPPRGTLGAAIRYALTRWQALCRFLDDGRIELDTIAVERTMRPVALERRSSTASTPLLTSETCSSA